nr:single-stranded DNA-binding protein [Sanguibacter hominis]
MVYGNLAVDPELSQTPNRRSVAKVIVMENLRALNKDSGRYEPTGETRRHVVECWQRLAENVAASLRSGDPVVFSGRVKPEAYINGNGEATIAVTVTADFLAPDLRWATATVIRNPRRDQDGPSPRVAQAVAGSSAQWPPLAPTGSDVGPV